MLTETKLSQYIYFPSLAVVDVWQSSINGSISGADVLRAQVSQVCSQTKTAAVDDDPFFAIDFGKYLLVNYIVFNTRYLPTGKPFISSPSIDYTCGDLGPLLLIEINSDSGLYALINNYTSAFMWDVITNTCPSLVI